MSASPEQFTGYAAMNKEEGQAWTVKPWSYKPQEWNEKLVDIKIDYCGICGSCLHTLSSGWGKTNYPAICGHEIVGSVVRAGKDSEHQVGDLVGVGAQSGSCMECEFCKAGDENHCLKGMIGTYQGKWSDGSMSQGGYADYVRVMGHFAVNIPKGLKPEVAAPMLCAGVTTYAPLKRHLKPGMKCAIVGIGGLGHLGLQWAKALGAETFAISHSDSKKQDAEKLGVKPENFIIAKDQAETVAKWKGSFDVILCTSFQADLPLAELYFPLLRPYGSMLMVGLPEEPISFRASAMIMKSLSLSGSIIGNVATIKEMFETAVAHDVKTWVEVRPMKDASQAIADMDAGKPRYRYVLSNKE